MRATATLTVERTHEWFASWFDSEHYHRLYSNRDQREATAFVERLIGHLDPDPGVAMLDLGCGSGRHSRSLAAHGYRVTGIDLSPASLARARQLPGPRVRFVEQDMRTPFGRNEFDYVFSLFTSLGYFEDYGDNATVVRNIARSLVTGGTLVIDYLNVKSAERNLIANEIAVRGEFRYGISRWTTDAAFFKRIVLLDPPSSSPVEHVERVSKLTLQDFQRLLAASGLTIDGVFGSYALDQFDETQSPRLIIIARKTTALVGRLPACESLADPAERFGRHTEIGREHGLRDALHDRRVGALELEIPLLGGGAQRADDALVLGGVVPLQAGPEGGGVAGHALDDALMGRAINQQHFGVLDRLDEVLGRRPVVQALRVGEPPRLGRELDDVLLAFRVDDEIAQATDGNKRGMAAHVAGALEELAGSEAFLRKGGADDVEIGVGEGGARLEVGAQDAER